MIIYLYIYIYKGNKQCIQLKCRQLYVSEAIQILFEHSVVQ